MTFREYLTDKFLHIFVIVNYLVIIIFEITVAKQNVMCYNVFVENWFFHKFYTDYYNKENIK